jgi:hypothetical protein
LLFMKEVQRILSDEDLRKREERRNKPSRIASLLLEAMRPIEAPSTRYDGMLENVADAIARHQLDGSSFNIDTIVCPLYSFGNGVGAFEDFSVISGLESSLESQPRYLAKFQRYLAALSSANALLGHLESPIPVKSRIFFGDAGILGVDVIKGRLGIETDDELRQALSPTIELYKNYLGKQGARLGLGNVQFQFGNITDIAPQLKQLPMNLYDIAGQSGISQLDYFSPREISKLGVDGKIVRTAQNTAQVYALGRKRERGYGISIEKQTYQEVIGFMLGYGIAGKAMVEQSPRTDLFIACDPPGNYRNDFYYTFLGKKGEKLAVFTPGTIDQIREEGLFSEEK